MCMRKLPYKVWSVADVVMLACDFSEAIQMTYFIEYLDKQHSCYCVLIWR